MTKAITIKTYLDELKKQINKNSDLTYVILNLEDSNVDELSNLLTKEQTIKYIMKFVNYEEPMMDKNGNKWALMISGFKHGAKKNSPRKIGLVAYKQGYKFYFKSKPFYHSSIYSKYQSTKENKERIVVYILLLIKDYLKNSTNYNESTNYIKPEKKVKK
jgi:hypothetical protein